MASYSFNDLTSISLEQGVIGAMLLDGRNIAICRPILAPSDFSHSLHILIVELIYQFDEEGKSISPNALNTWIKHDPAVVETNKLWGEDFPPGREGAFYLVGLVRDADSNRDTTLTPTNLEADAMAVAELAQRRRARGAIDEAIEGLIGMGGTVPLPILTALAPIVTVADDITDRQMANVGETSAVHLGHALLREISQQAVSGEQFGMRTEIDPLDEILGGLYPEQQIIIGGRPGMGKSILACKLLLSAARQGYAADFWSIEMSSNEVVARLQCDLDYDMAIREQLKPLHYEDLVKMRADGPTLERAVHANQLLGDMDITVFAQGRVTMDQISSVSRARAARDKGKRRLVIVDHLQIVTPGGRYSGNRVNELADITGAGKRLAKRIGAPVVLLSQLSRDLERRDDKRPYLSDFRDSGSIEQDADVAMAIYRGEYYAEAALRQAKSDDQRDKAWREKVACQNVLEIEVLKQRSGQTKTVKCFIDVASSVVRSENPKTAAAPRQSDLQF